MNKTTYEEIILKIEERFSKLPDDKKIALQILEDLKLGRMSSSLSKGQLKYFSKRNVIDILPGLIWVIVRNVNGSRKYANRVNAKKHFEDIRKSIKRLQALLSSSQTFEIGVFWTLWGNSTKSEGILGPPYRTIEFWLEVFARLMDSSKKHKMEVGSAYSFNPKFQKNNQRNELIRSLASIFVRHTKSMEPKLIHLLIDTQTVVSKLGVQTDINQIKTLLKRMDKPILGGEHIPSETILKNVVANLIKETADLDPWSGQSWFGKNKSVQLSKK